MPYTSSVASANASMQSTMSLVTFRDARDINKKKRSAAGKKAKMVCDTARSVLCQPDRDLWETSRNAAARPLIAPGTHAPPPMATTLRWHPPVLEYLQEAPSMSQRGSTDGSGGGSKMSASGRLLTARRPVAIAERLAKDSSTVNALDSMGSLHINGGQRDRPPTAAVERTRSSAVDFKRHTRSVKDQRTDTVMRSAGNATRSAAYLEATARMRREAEEGRVAAEEEWQEEELQRTGVRPPPRYGSARSSPGTPAGLWDWGGSGPAESLLDTVEDDDEDYSTDHDAADVGGLSTSFASFEWGHLGNGEASVHMRGSHRLLGMRPELNRVRTGANDAERTRAVQR